MGYNFRNQGESQSEYFGLNRPRNVGTQQSELRCVIKALIDTDSVKSTNHTDYISKVFERAAEIRDKNNSHKL